MFIEKTVFLASKLRNLQLPGGSDKQIKEI